MHGSPKTTIAIGVASLTAGVVATLLMPGFLWYGAIVVGLFEIGIGSFALLREREVAKLAASGASHWTCKSCDQDNPMDGDFVCSRCRLPFKRVSWD